MGAIYVLDPEAGRGGLLFDDGLTDWFMGGIPVCWYCILFEIPVWATEIGFWNADSTDTGSGGIFITDLGPIVDDSGAPVIIILIGYAICCTRLSWTSLFLNDELEDFLTKFTTLLLSCCYMWDWVKVWFTTDICGWIWDWGMLTCETWDWPCINWDITGWIPCEIWELIIWDCYTIWGWILETCIGGIGGKLCLFEIFDCPTDCVCILLISILIFCRLSPSDWDSSLARCNAV